MSSYMFLMHFWSRNKRIEKFTKLIFFWEEKEEDGEKELQSCE